MHLGFQFWPLRDNLSSSNWAALMLGVDSIFVEMGAVKAKDRKVTVKNT